MRFTFCSFCAEPLARRSRTLYVCPSGHETYNEPVAAVGTVLIRDGRILVSKRAQEPNKGEYDLPGGFFEFNESWQAAAIRELEEETGIICYEEDLELLAAYTGLYKPDESTIDLIVIVHDWHGEPIAKDDSAALEWKPLSFLDDEHFCAPYPGLRTKLEQLLAEVVL